MQLNSNNNNNKPYPSCWIPRHTLSYSYRRTWWPNKKNPKIWRLYLSQTQQVKFINLD